MDLDNFNKKVLNKLKKKKKWDSLHARLGSHYIAWSYYKNKHKKIKAYKKSI